ncbi:hypothetical protein RhiJN_13669 [Ceratobasidium sp. AG-Ba]|nr:hypothetical protein RhiJN_13669 [Ceratobasidium sp. AG-Ba]
MEGPPQTGIEDRPANPSPPRSSPSTPAPEEAPPEGNKEEYERLLNGPIEDIQRAAARVPTLGFFFRVLDRDVVPDSVCQNQPEFWRLFWHISGMQETETEPESAQGCRNFAGFRGIPAPAGMLEFPLWQLRSIF